jgi:hypothetical protein
MTAPNKKTKKPKLFLFHFVYFGCFGYTSFICKGRYGMIFLAAFGPMVNFGNGIIVGIETGW